MKNAMEFHLDKEHIIARCTELVTEIEQRLGDNVMIFFIDELLTSKAFAESSFRVAAFERWRLERVRSVMWFAERLKYDYAPDLASELLAIEVANVRHNIPAFEEWLAKRKPTSKPSRPVPTPIGVHHILELHGLSTWKCEDLDKFAETYGMSRRLVPGNGRYRYETDEELRERIRMAHVGLQ